MRRHMPFKRSRRSSHSISAVVASLTGLSSERRNVGSANRHYSRGGTSRSACCADAAASRCRSAAKVRCAVAMDSTSTLSRTRPALTRVGSSPSSPASRAEIVAVLLSRQNAANCDWDQPALRRSDRIGLSSTLTSPADEVIIISSLTVESTGSRPTLKEGC